MWFLYIVLIAIGIFVIAAFTGRQGEKKVMASMPDIENMSIEDLKKWYEGLAHRKGFLPDKTKKYIEKRIFNASFYAPLYNNSTENKESKSQGFYVSLDEKEAEELLMWQIDDIQHDKEKVRQWFNEKKSQGTWFPTKVYARAMAILEDKEWLSDEEYQQKVEDENKRIELIQNREKALKDAIKSFLKADLSFDKKMQKIENLISKNEIPNVLEFKKDIFWNTIDEVSRGSYPSDLKEKVRSMRRSFMIKYNRNDISVDNIPFEEMHSNIFNK